MKTFLAEMRGKPYECFEYNPRKVSCSGLTRRSVSGNRMTMDVSFREFMRGAGPVDLTMSVDFEIRENTFCGRMADADFSISAATIPPHIAKQIISDVRRRFERDGMTCNQYIRDAEGRIYSRSIDRSGRVRGSVDRLWFFAAPKPLLG